MTETSIARISNGISAVPVASTSHGRSRCTRLRDSTRRVAARQRSAIARAFGPATACSCRLRIDTEGSFEFSNGRIEQGQCFVNAGAVRVGSLAPAVAAGHGIKARPERMHGGARRPSVHGGRRHAWIVGSGDGAAATMGRSRCRHQWPGRRSAGIVIFRAPAIDRHHCDRKCGRRGHRYIDVPLIAGVFATGLSLVNAAGTGRDRCRGVQCGATPAVQAACAGLIEAWRWSGADDGHRGIRWTVRRTVVGHAASPQQRIDRIGGGFRRSLHSRRCGLEAGTAWFGGSDERFRISLRHPVARCRRRERIVVARAVIRAVAAVVIPALAAARHAYSSCNDEQFNVACGDGRSESSRNGS